MRGTGYPIVLDLAGRPVLVVGGGPVGARRAVGLLAAGARVTVVAPQAVPELRELAAGGSLTWWRRPHSPGDGAGAWLVHACTGVAEVDAAVAAEAEAAGTWCVRASDAASSAAWTPAVLRRPDGSSDGRTGGVAEAGAGPPLTVAVSGGGDPRRARALRDAIAALLDAGDLPTARHRPERPVGGGR